jgi:hypothetical protein
MSRALLQIKAIGENVERLAGEEVMRQVMEGSERLASSAKPEKVAAWVKGAIDRLDTLADEGTRREIMQACGFNCALANQSPIEKAKARRKRFPTLDAFLVAEQYNPPAGTRLSRVGDILYQYYIPHSFTHPMRCYCSLLRGLPAGETASLTYCQCSRGFVMKFWEEVLGRPVQVEILQSAVSGADECLFAIHL